MHEGCSSKAVKLETGMAGNVGSTPDVEEWVWLERSVCFLEERSQDLVFMYVCWCMRMSWCMCETLRQASKSLVFSFYHMDPEN